MVIFHGYVKLPNDKSLVSVRFRYSPMISGFPNMEPVDEKMEGLSSSVKFCSLILM